jgi:hypothetical protein
VIRRLLRRMRKMRFQRLKKKIRFNLGCFKCWWVWASTTLSPRDTALSPRDTAIGFLDTVLSFRVTLIERQTGNLAFD